MKPLLHHCRVLGASLFLIGQISFAQEPPPPAPTALPWAPETPVEDLSGPAQKLFDDAKQARKDKRFDDCYRNALGAWKLAPRAGVAALLGDCALDVGKPRDAAEHIAFFLANVPANATPELLNYQKERFAAAKQQVAIVTVKPSVAGAKVTVDKRDVDGAAVYLDPGAHTFEATAEGYEPASATVELTAGSEREVALEMVPLPIDGNGDEGGGSWIGYAPGGIVLGIGVAGLAAGIGVLVAASGKTSSADDKLEELRAATGTTEPCLNPNNAAPCAEIADLRDEHDTLLGVGRGVAIGGGAVVATGVVLLIIAAVTAEDAPAEASGETALWAPPGSMGLGLSTRY
jgi:hypothetical protein